MPSHKFDIKVLVDDHFLALKVSRKFAALHPSVKLMHNKEGVLLHSSCLISVCCFSQDVEPDSASMDPEVSSSRLY